MSLVRPRPELSYLVEKILTMAAQMLCCAAEDYRLVAGGGWTQRQAMPAHAGRTVLYSELFHLAGYSDIDADGVGCFLF